MALPEYRTHLFYLLSNPLYENKELFQAAFQAFYPLKGIWEHEMSFTEARFVIHLCNYLWYISQKRKNNKNNVYLFQ